ncbi:hypothetical protein [Rhizobium glycinendophyticum]|uniref:Uncharacterized protein n=1 Tax=Rhizobium glycinendophyticum TaxID=2589807 RepID=A0A504UK43_9HYPH|nr:hypothetical protein [Rhizobium glycinendophyticum]TPP09626.1 hypothetical protein FJQ55_01745 [Rhizobium glycinendophyticum]
MFKNFWKTSVQPRNQVAQDWRHDPLGHPALLAMNQRALADLPMVAEVPVRMSTVQVADGCRRGADEGIVEGCAVSR